MKPETNLIPADQFYYNIHRMHSARFIFALFLLSASIVASLISVFFGAVMLTIWLLLAATFLTVVSVVEFRACDTYYDKHVRALVASQRV